MTCNDTHTDCHSCWCNGMQYARICFAFTYIAIPADAYLLNGYALNGYVLMGYVLDGYVLMGYVLDGYVLTGYVHTLDRHCMDTHWIDTYWWDTYWMDTYWMDTYGKDTYWQDTSWMDMRGMMFIDMHGVRYANNLLKNPATKRLSGKRIVKSHKPASTQKKQNLIHLCQSVPHRVSNFWFLRFLSICRFGDFSLSKLLIFLSICRFCALLASFFFWIYAGLVNLKSQTYIFATFEWYDFFQSIFLFQYVSN